MERKDEKPIYKETPRNVKNVNEKKDRVFTQAENKEEDTDKKEQYLN